MRMVLKSYSMYDKKKDIALQITDSLAFLATLVLIIAALNGCLT